MRIVQIVNCENWFFVSSETITEHGKKIGMVVAPGDLAELSGSMPIAAWGLTEEGLAIGLVAVTGGGHDAPCQLVPVPPVQGRYVHRDTGSRAIPDSTVNELQRILDRLKKDCSHAALIDFVLNPAGKRQDSELDGHQYEWLDQHTGSCGDDHYGTISFRIGMVYAVFEYNC